MIASRLSDTALVISAVGLFVTTTTAAVVSVLTFLLAKEVKTEVKTMNGLTIAQMADATETRRVDAIPPADRSEIEQEHIEVLPIPEEPS